MNQLLTPTATTTTSLPIRTLQRWHLLSLDAPTVATLWTWFIASSQHIQLPAAAVVSMFLAVWILYAADRLLDAGLLSAHPLDTGTLEARHHFHHRHRTAFLTGILLASAALAALLPQLSPEAIRLYLILGTLVFAYFVLIHATRAAHRLPKEFAVGICFAAAIFIPTVARRPDLRLPLLAPALLFAALCSLNCLFIYAWEHTQPALHPAHPTTALALRYLVPTAVTAAAVGVALTLLTLTPDPGPQARLIPAATTVSIALLLLLHHRRQPVAPLTLRAAADLVLLTPLLLLLR